MSESMNWKIEHKGEEFAELSMKSAYTLGEMFALAKKDEAFRNFIRKNERFGNITADAVEVTKNGTYWYTRPVWKKVGGKWKLTSWKTKMKVKLPDNGYAGKRHKLGFPLRTFKKREDAVKASGSKDLASWFWNPLKNVGIYCVHRSFWDERFGPWYVDTGSRPDDWYDNVGAVLSKEAASGASMKKFEYVISGLTEEQADKLNDIIVSYVESHDAKLIREAFPDIVKLLEKGRLKLI